MIKLKNVVINKYKSFLEKQEIEIEDGVTRIVGKNESGKTALLEAMAKFNYFDSKDKTFTFNSTNDYPRGELKRYQQEYPNEDFDVLVYGHFHTGFIKEFEGKLFVNAGSISLPKNGTKNSYLIIDETKISLKDVDGNLIEEVNI